MRKKEELLRKIKELEEDQRARIKREKKDVPYNPRQMRSGMPLGCFLWILGGIALCIYLFIKNN